MIDCNNNMRNDRMGNSCAGNHRTANGCMNNNRAGNCNMGNNPVNPRIPNCNAGNNPANPRIGNSGNASTPPCMNRPQISPSSCMDNCSNCDPIAMGYVPWQTWNQTYPIEKGLQRGTIFPDLDLPFVMGRCR